VPQDVMQHINSKGFQEAIPPGFPALLVGTPRYQRTSVRGFGESRASCTDTFKVRQAIRTDGRTRSRTKARGRCKSWPAHAQRYAERRGWAQREGSVTYVS
jgi:hypothetical protein